MQKYLVFETENVYGSKGFNDNQFTRKFTSTSKLFSLLEKDDEFHWELEADDDILTREQLLDMYRIVHKDDKLGGEDGYTKSTFSYSVKALTDAEYLFVNTIIDEYDKL